MVSLDRSTNKETGKWNDGQTEALSQILIYKCLNTWLIVIDNRDIRLNLRWYSSL